MRFEKLPFKPKINCFLGLCSQFVPHCSHDPMFFLLFVYLRKSASPDTVSSARAGFPSHSLRKASGQAMESFSWVFARSSFLTARTPVS